MEENEKIEPKRPDLPEGYRWADELAKEALDSIGADEKTMAYDTAERLAENIDDPYPQDTVNEIADSYVNPYNHTRRKWLMADGDHLEAFENAIQEGLVDMDSFDLDHAIGVGWCKFNEDLLASSAEDIQRAALFLTLGELVEGEPYFALSPAAIEAVEQMPFDDDLDNLLPLSEDLVTQIEEMQAASTEKPLAVGIKALWREQMMLDGRRPETRWHEAEEGLYQQAVLADYAKQQGLVHDGKGEWYDAEAMAQTMDGDLREELHQVFALEATDQTFMERYAYQHAKRFGEAWQPENGVEFAGTERGLEAFAADQEQAKSSPCRLKDEATDSRNASNALSANEKAQQAPSASKEVR